LITGGSSGIGLSTAVLLLSLSAKVTILDLQSPPANSFSQNTNNPNNVLVLLGDIRSWKYQRSSFKTAVEKFGQIDGVFVNAGIGEVKDVFFTDELEEDGSGELKEPDHKVLDIDIKATADTVKLAIHYMRRNNGGGGIVATASLAGYLASKGMPLYSAAKHGVVGLMRSLKNDLAALNIAISVVAPAITVTPLLNYEGTRILSQEVKRMSEAGVPLNKAETVAATTAWLLSLGMKANGKGVLIQADRMVDLEEGLVKSRSSWIGEEMLNLFRSGRALPGYSKLDAKL